MDLVINGPGVTVNVFNADNTSVMTRLDTMEEKMSEILDAIGQVQADEDAQTAKLAALADSATRIEADFARLNDVLAGNGALTPDVAAALSTLRSSIASHSAQLGTIQGGIDAADPAPVEPPAAATEPATTDAPADSAVSSEPATVPAADTATE